MRILFIKTWFYFFALGFAWMEQGFSFQLSSTPKPRFLKHFTGKVLVQPNGGGGFMGTHQPVVVFASTASSDTSSTDVDSSSKDVAAAAAPKEEWTKARTHNKNSVRALALLGALAAAGLTSQSSPLVPAQVASTVHLLSFGTWFGTMVYTTFIAGLTMFKNMPRKMFGKVQSKLFPKYFALCSATLVLQLVTLSSLSVVAGAGSAAASAATTTTRVKSIRALGLGLVMTLLNQFYLEPKSTNIMFERYRLDDVPGGPETEEYKSLKSQFGKLHGMSSLTNLIALCTGVAHAVFLAAGLAAK